MNGPEKGRVVILGAGLAGLSTAYHLEAHRPVTILEKENRPGGMTRSFRVNGFVFDLTGHLLHLRRREVRDLVQQILPDGMASIDRRSFVYSHGTYTDYPFQANLHGLPPEVVRDCVVGFVETLTNPRTPPAGELADGSFHQWALATFGKGIAEHFLFPYNRKLWCRDLREVTAEWVSWAVPRPTVDEVVGGALGLVNRGLGYNPSFLYPKAGGIEVLPNALAAGLRSTTLRLGAAVSGIDPVRHRVRTGQGEELAYDHLVSTLPLPRLVSLMQEVPDDLREAAAGLQATRVLNVNLGIARANVTHRHWIYFPENRFIFYRVGSPTAFCQASAPEGCSSLYVEVARTGVCPADIPGLVRQVREDLVACGLLRPDDRIVAEQSLVIDPAYVVYDAHRRQVLPEIHGWLAGHHIDAIGRYGRWEYGSMEDAIWQGMETASRLASRISPADETSPRCVKEPWQPASASR
ncbi:MAG: protoporphyrinogen/coproporphyrinogen oxidase [Acidobacteriota bacterium]